MKCVSYIMNKLLFYAMKMGNKNNYFNIFDSVSSHKHV